MVSSAQNKHRMAGYLQKSDFMFGHTLRNTWFPIEFRDNKWMSLFVEGTLLEIAFKPTGGTPKPFFRCRASKTRKTRREATANPWSLAATTW